MGLDQLNVGRGQGGEGGCVEKMDNFFWIGVDKGIFFFFNFLVQNHPIRKNNTHKIFLKI